MKPQKPYRDVEPISSFFRATELGSFQELSTSLDTTDAAAVAPAATAHDSC
jgi:hypothetical protein